MTYDEFIKKHKGVAVDFDGAAKAQCVDLATAYFYEVFNSKIKNFWFDAHHFWDLFDNNPWLKKNMTKIENKPETVPQKGDVAVWKGSLNGGWGHIAICTGEGNTNYFYSYDQNWTGHNDACTKIKHNYNHIAGFLRPKDQSKIKKEATSSAAEKNKVPAGGNSKNDNKKKPKVTYKDYYVIETSGADVCSAPNGTIKSPLMYKEKVSCVVGSERGVNGITWIKTKSNDWIIKEYLSTTKPTTKKTTYTDYYVTATDELNYRTSINGTIKGAYKKGTKITVIDGSDKTVNGLVWVKTKDKYWVAKKYLTKKAPTAAAPFKANTDYTLQADLKVRSGAGTGYAQKKTSALTVKARKSAYNQTYAVLKKGTKITALKVIKKSDKEYWVQIPSGYICAMQQGKKFIK